MIERLRWKFIGVTMAAVFSVLLLIVLAINAVNVWQSNAALDRVTLMLLEGGGAFRQFDDGFRPDRMDGGRQRPDGMDRFHEKELPFATRFFTVTLDSDGGVVGQNLGSIASVSGEEAEQLAAAVLAKGRAAGWYQTWRYRVGEVPNGVLVIAVEATSTRSSIYSVLGITLAVGAFALLAIFALLLPLSKRAIQPIAETYEKQKQFITNASHELKTPLTVISANAELLGMTCGENEWSDGILRQCEHMRSLVGKMVQMSRLDEGAQNLAFEGFDLGEAVYDTATSFRGPAAAKGLTLTVDVPQEAPFKADEGAIRQMVSALMDNALKYCDAGGAISVSMKKELRGFGREKYRISVSNTFAALDCLDTDKLFERFYRADPAHTVGNSYGLGLPIARSIAEQHGGNLNARKQPPDTIIFTAVLPG